MIDFACKEFNLQEVIKCSLGLSASEYDILVFMLKSGVEYDSETLSKQLKLDITTVQRALKKLHERDVILRKQVNLDHGGYLFKYKISNKKHLKEIILGIVKNWTSKVELELDKW